MGKCNSCLLWYAPHSPRTSCVFTSWVSSGLTVGGPKAPRWQVFFPSWVSSELISLPLVVAINWWLWLPLFTHTTGNIPFLTFSLLLLYISWCWLKKKWTTWKLWVKIFGGQNEDCGLGESMLESSEKLLQRGRVEGVGVGVGMSAYM